MADAKITALTANTTPLGTDIIPMVDDPGGTPVTQKITLANLGIIDGWIPASETWEYASASTITVPSGAASLYQKGDRIKWTQTTVKYGVIVAVADTLLTIAVNTDYTVANAAISANYYSHQANPIGYPGWFAYTPTFTGFSSNPASPLCKFSITGRVVTLKIHTSAGTSNATGFTMTAPVGAEASTGGVTGQHTDNGANPTAPCLFIVGTDASITFYKDLSGASWTTSGNKAIAYTTISYLF